MDNQDIENLIKKSLMQLKEILERDTLKYNIFFPKYSSEKTRYSEQELKCLFLSNIYKSEFLYTVETPSKRAYRFKNKKPLVLWENKVSNDTYKSSMIDVSLYAGKKENLLSYRIQAWNRICFSDSKRFPKNDLRIRQCKEELFCTLC